eukprot:c29236_g1_i1 orf=2-229(-)
MNKTPILNVVPPILSTYPLCMHPLCMQCSYKPLIPSHSEPLPNKAESCQAKGPLESSTMAIGDNIIASFQIALTGF